MSAFDLTNTALADLKSIATYTQERWGARQRNTYLKEIDRVFHSLAKSPVMGRTCDEVREGYRKFPHGSHVIYYMRPNTSEVLIIRILHMTMDVDAHLGA